MDDLFPEARQMIRNHWEGDCVSTDMEIPKHLKGIPVSLLMEPKSGVNRNYINHWWVCIEINGVDHALYWCKGYPSAQANKNEHAAMWTWKQFVEAGVFKNVLVPAAYVPQTGDGIDEIWFDRYAVSLHNFKHHLLPSDCL